MRALLLLVLSACTLDQITNDGHQGTAVGNPGRVSVQAADVPQGIALGVARADVVSLFLDDCDGAGPTVAGAVIDLLDPELLAVPTGDWCALELTLRDGEGVWLEGTADEVPFEMILDPGPLWFEGELNTSAGVVVQLPLDGLDAGAIADAPAGAPIAPDDPAAIASSEALIDGATTQPLQQPDASEAQSSCQHAPGGIPWLVLAGLTLLMRTRRGYET